MQLGNFLEEKVLRGQTISKEEAQALAGLQEADLYSLFTAAARIRDARAGKKVDLCSIINAKSGHCSENCKFCAQSAHYRTKAPVYDLLSQEEILERARQMEQEGAQRFSLVLSGRGVQEQDFERILDIYELLARETNLQLCASLGIIDQAKAAQLKKAGVSMYHHNLETSESYFPQICTTHGFQDRIETIKAVQSAGLDVCSGGIFAMGESMEQRLEMAFTLRELGVKSVPINILNPIEGTPLAGQPLPHPMEILKTIAIYRFILPEAMLRFAGGRERALRHVEAMGYWAGINACLVGSYLTTSGRTVKEDLQTIEDMGLIV